MVGVCGDQLGKLGVASTELLQNRLEHLGLLLNDLTELLELSIVPKEVEVTESLSSGGTSSCSSASTGARATSATALALLGREIEQIDSAFLVTAGTSAGCSAGACRGSLLCRGLVGWLFRLLEILGNTLVAIGQFLSALLRRSS